METSSIQIKNIVSGSRANKIAIIGKGPSIQNIDLNKLDDDYIIINLNDSERIIEGDFSILHRPWAYQSVKENGFKSKLYISDIPISSVRPQSLTVRYLPDTYDSIETTVKRLLHSELYIADFLFLTAIKISLIISESLQEKIEVFFFGFDFGVSDKENSSTQISTDKDDRAFKQAFLQTQKDYFIKVRNYFKKHNESIDIIHVGNHEFSDLSIEKFNSLSNTLIRYEKIPPVYNSNLYYKKVRESEKGRTLVVAELTNNHIGDYHRLSEMVKLAKEAGADLIKVQKRNVVTFYSKEELDSEYNSPFGDTLRDYRQGVEMDDEMFKHLAVECFKNEIAWFATILDEESLKFIKKYDCPLLKIPSTISNHKNYIRRFAESYHGDVVVSTGFTDKKYEEFILDLFGTRNKNLWLLQCTSSYPTPPDACQIAVVRHYHNLSKYSFPNLHPGYSSHDIGHIGCMLAVAAGAKMIEKHVKLGDLGWVHYDGVAVDLYNNGFKDFISQIRKAELMCGKEEKTVHFAEHHKYIPNSVHN